MRQLGFLGLCLLLTVGWGDISFSGSSSAGMGGAGIAVLRRPERQASLNPAAVAYVKSFRIGAGSIDTSARGASLRTLIDDLDVGSGSAADLATTASLLRKFARRDTQLVLTGDLGLFANGFGISVGGLLDARLLPNEALRTWARTDGNPATIPNTARGDLIAVSAFSLPDVTAGVRFTADDGELAVGAKIRFLRFYYTHYLAQGAQLQGNAGVRAPELQGRNYIERSATGIDLGFIWRPAGNATYTIAGVIENFVEPNVRFEATDRDGQVFRFKPFERTYHLGVAFDLETGTLFVMDLVDIGNNAGRGEIRAGVEQRFGRFALRTGYASRTGWTAGVGLGGFNLAYSEQFPVVVSRTLKF
ncbi:MAG: conjugal transfer protein TraF [Fimbriimonadales bacterium]